MQDLQSMEVWVNEALALFERNFPRSEALYTLYQMCHLNQQVRDFGPLRDTWMFPFEIFMQVVKKSCKNR